MQLRPYQTSLIDQVLAKFHDGKRAVVLQAGTGAGKTAMASEMLRRCVENGFPHFGPPNLEPSRAVFIARLDELITDTHARLNRAGIYSGFVQAGRKTEPLARVQVASLQTLHSRKEYPPADFVILDECHCSAASSSREVLAAYPNVPILGLTACSQRGDGQPLSEFDDIVCGPQNRELIEAGYLVPFDVYCPPAPIDALALAMCPVDAYERFSPGLRALVFAQNIAHATELREKFISRGHATELITGETARETRKGIRERIRTGETKVIVNVGVFVEGVDVPSIECIILARGFSVTMSFLQACGRGSRPSPETGKTKCTIVDLKGSVLFHGLPSEDRLWALTGNATRRVDLTPLRRCKECLAVFKIMTKCPRCGAINKVIEKLPRILNRDEKAADKLAKLSHLTPAQRDEHYLYALMMAATKRLQLPLAAAERWALDKFRKTFHREPEGREDPSAAAKVRMGEIRL